MQLTSNLDNRKSKTISKIVFLSLFSSVTGLHPVDGIGPAFSILKP